MAFPRTTIARLRWSKGLTQQELADLAGLHLETVQLMERGRSRGSVKSVAKLADALHCDPDSLVTALINDFIGTKTYNKKDRVEGTETDTDSDNPPSADGTDLKGDELGGQAIDSTQVT